MRHNLYALGLLVRRINSRSHNRTITNEDFYARSIDEDVERERFVRRNCNSGLPGTSLAPASICSIESKCGGGDGVHEDGMFGAGREECQVE